MAKKKMTPSELTQADQFNNSLSSLCATIASGIPNQGFGAQLSQSATQFVNLRWYLISNYRQLLSQMYVEHGIVQTLIEQPVDDAFRAGFEIKTSQLSKDEIEEVKIYLERNKVIHAAIQGIKWGRLYGGGGVMVLTGKDMKQPLVVKENMPIEFRAVDMWELYFTIQNTNVDTITGEPLDYLYGDYYDYYGHKVHKSHVYRIIGKEAPSFIRPRLRGWGMSEIERLIRSLNQYMKNQDVIFDLLDEAKVDVYGIKGYNNALLSSAGTANVAKRIQGANMIKNFQNALTMDTEDTYTQKQITFSGLAEVLLQIRQGIAADLKMPMTKLFGVSAAGFNSGEDDIENYNSMLESEIRSKNKFMIVDLVRIACQHIFGMVPDDLMIEFNPLRILNAKEEEEVKDSQFNRVMASFQSGLISAQEAKSSINKDSLLGIEVDETTDALPPIDTGADYAIGGAAKGKGGKQTPTEA